MLFHKSLVSLVIAFATASSVSASITPVARCGDHCPQPEPSYNECNTGPIKCCNTVAKSNSKSLEGLPQSLIDLALHAPIAAALDCTEVISATDW
jgi:Fungal hydrophobin